MPVALEVVDWAVLVSVLVTVMAALGMGLLEGSVTVPVRRAVKVWALTAMVRRGRSFHTFPIVSGS